MSEHFLTQITQEWEGSSQEELKITVFIQSWGGEVTGVWTPQRLSVCCVDNEERDLNVG